MTPEEASARLINARVGTLATVRPDGKPHVVPFVFALVDAGDLLIAYWMVDGKPKRSQGLRRLENIRSTSAVEFVVDSYEEDWAALWWVRASGTARVVLDPGERGMAIEALRAKYPQYRNSASAGEVVAIDIDRIMSWEATARSR